MVNPTGAWDQIPVYGFFFLDDETPVTGKVTLSMTARTRRTDGRRVDPAGRTMECTVGDLATPTARMIAAQVHDAWLAADQTTLGDSFDQATWDVWWATMLTGAVFASFPASDDPDIAPTGFQVKVVEGFAGGKTYNIQPVLADLTSSPPGVNLGTVTVTA